MSASPLAPDPVRLEVFHQLLAAVCEEAGALLSRSAISPNIRQRRDFSCALFDGEARLVAQYKERFNHPYLAAAHGYVDDVIKPRETRPALIRALELCSRKRDRNPPRKHGNIPL